MNLVKAGNDYYDLDKLIAAEVAAKGRGKDLRQLTLTFAGGHDVSMPVDSVRGEALLAYLASVATDVNPKPEPPPPVEQPASEPTA
jgi:hypothetical protein